VTTQFTVGEYLLPVGERLRFNVDVAEAKYDVVEGVIKNFFIIVFEDMDDLCQKLRGAFVSGAISVINNGRILHN
jgi:hypothetical protein